MSSAILVESVCVCVFKIILNRKSLRSCYASFFLFEQELGSDFLLTDCNALYHFILFPWYNLIRATYTN